MNMNRVFIAMIVSVAALVSGCGSIDKDAVSRRVTSKSIAVLSTAGTEIHLAWIGTTVFNNEFRAMPFPGDQLNEAIESTVVEVLNSTRRYSRVFKLHPRLGEVQEQLHAVPADYLLWVKSASISDPRFQTNQVFNGVGLFQRTILNSSPTTFAHVAVELKLIDVRTREEVASVREVNSWPAEMKLTPGPVLSAENFQLFQQRVLHRAPGVVASMLEPLGVR